MKQIFQVTPTIISNLRFSRWSLIWRIYSENL